MKILNKKIAALLLSLCFCLCAIEAAAGGAGKPVEEPDDSFFAKITRDADCESKFLVTKNFTEVMDRLRESEARMIANNFDNIEQAWKCGENYIETLFTMGRQGETRFAKPEEQLQILDCLLKAIYFTPIGGIGKSGDHWKEKREAMLLKYKPNNTGARCDRKINDDYIQKLVFLSMHGNYSKMRVTGPLNSNYLSGNTKRSQFLPNHNAQTVYEKYSRHTYVPTIVEKDREDTAMKYQIRPLLRLMLERSGATTLVELNKYMGDRETYLENTFGRFGEFYFGEHHPSNYEGIKSLSAWRHIFKAKPSSPEFRIATEVYCQFALENFKVEPRVINQVNALISQLGKKIRLPSASLHDVNHAKRLASAVTTKGTKVTVHVLDFFEERPDSSDKAKLYSHGNIVSEIVRHYGNGMVEAVSRDLSDVYGDHKITESVRLEKEAGLHERVISFLNSLDKEAIVNMSFRFLTDDDSVKDAIFRFLSRGNILFMALGNEGDDVSTRQSTLAGIVDYVARKAGSNQEILKRFRLVGNLSVDPVLEVTKVEGDSYIAAMSPESISQKPGTSRGIADLAAHLQSMTSVASGGFYSEKYKTYFDGTSSATPAHAGAVGAAIAILISKGLTWENASAVALGLLSTTLEKTYKVLQWRFSQEGIALGGQSELPLPRAVFGEGALNYEAYLTAVISYRSEAAPDPVLAVPLPADAPGEKFYGADLHTLSVTSGRHSSHTHAVATGPWTPESAVTAEPVASIFLPSRDPLSDILQDLKRIAEAEERARAIAAAEMARKLIEERKAQAAETRKMAAEDRKSGADSDSESDDEPIVMMGNRILTQDLLKILAANTVPRSSKP